MVIGLYWDDVNADWFEYSLCHKCYKSPDYMFDTQSKFRPGSDTNNVFGIGILR